MTKAMRGAPQVVMCAGACVALVGSTYATSRRDESAEAQTPEWHLQLARRVQPADSSGGLLGNVVGITLPPDGGVYVAEAGPARVVRFGRYGKFLRVMMATGEGPGEVRSAVIAAEGDTLVTFDIDADNDWWIGRPGPGGALASWDVVRSGRPVAHVDVPGPVGDVFPDGPVRAVSTREVALLHEDADGRPWIGLYTVVRGSQ